MIKRYVTHRKRCMVPLWIPYKPFPSNPILIIKAPILGGKDVWYVPVKSTLGHGLLPAYPGVRVRAPGIWGLEGLAFIIVRVKLGRRRG